MKTNQIITRKMGDYEVYQRTKDSFFDASSLLRQWNERNPDSVKEIRQYLKLKSTQEFMTELVDKKPDGEKFGTDNELFTPVITIKGRKTKNGQTPDKHWMHPFAYIDFAMWLNPKFKVQVIKFVYDQLIKLRNDIGDQYREFSAACAKIGCVTQEDYKTMARCLNCVALGKDRQTNQRNELTEAEADEMRQLADFFIKAVDNGFITDINGAKTYFRREYDSKYTKSLPFNK